jgi:hypothetical protein
MDRYDYETLKDCLSHTYNKFDPLNMKVWYTSNDTMLSVASILKDEYIFSGDSISASLNNLLYFFEKPWKWENDIRELVIEYELEQVGKDIEHLATEQAEIAINWLDHYGFDSKVIDTLTESLEERYILCGYAPCGVK